MTTAAAARTTGATPAGGSAAPLRFGDRYGINTYSYMQSVSAADCLRRLADLGVRDFELMCYPGHLWITDGAAVLAEIRQVIAANDLRLMSLNTPNIDLNIAAATSEMRDLSLRINRQFLRLAEELGADGIVLGPGKANPLFPLPASVLEGYFFAALDILAPLAEKSGCALFVENMPFAYLPEAERLVATLERYGRADVKVCYDIANAHFIGEEPTAGLARCAERLGIVHISDTGRDAYRHDAIGSGTIDLRPLPAGLAAAGYRKKILLEIISTRADPAIAASIEALSANGI
jgi:sugar phosphate isomerase/epimerase